MTVDTADMWRAIRLSFLIPNLSNIHRQSGLNICYNWSQRRGCLCSHMPEQSESRIFSLKILTQLYASVLIMLLSMSAAVFYFMALSTCPCYLNPPSYHHHCYPYHHHHHHHHLHLHDHDHHCHYCQHHHHHHHHLVINHTSSLSTAVLFLSSVFSALRN